MIKPLAYGYTQMSGSGPDDYFEELGLIDVYEYDKSPEQFKKECFPLYAIPEGYALVPIEPTSRMLYASEETQLREFCTSSRQSRQHDIAGQIYAAMIKAGGVK